MIADRTTTVERRRPAAGGAVATAASAASAASAPARIAPVPAPPAAGRPIARRSMAHRGPRVVRRARQMRDRSPMLFALLSASFLVTLLCLYVTAYAGVNADRRELAQLKEETRAVEKEQRLLSAELARLRQPNVILERARGLGLVPAPPEAQHLLQEPATPGRLPD